MPRPPATGCGGAAAGPGVDGGISPVWTVEALRAGGRGRSPLRPLTAPRQIPPSPRHWCSYEVLRGRSRSLVAFKFGMIRGVLADAVWTGAALQSACGPPTGFGGAAAGPGIGEGVGAVPAKYLRGLTPWSPVLAKCPTSRPVPGRAASAAWRGNFPPGAPAPPGPQTHVSPSLCRAAITPSDPPPGRPSARPFVSAHLQYIKAPN